MIFSEYVVVEKAGVSVDPLAFLHAVNVITDRLFKQFTVLCAHPAYHGFLCFAYDYLLQEGVKRSDPDFARRFRDIEVLWGLMNVRHGGSIVNVNKYRRLLGRPDLVLSDVRRQGGLYEKLYYGTLGHYSSPSMAWGLIKEKGQAVTQAGHDLGEAWRRRGGHDFAAIVQKWLSNEAIMSGDTFDQLAQCFMIAAAPPAAEKEQWRKVIDQYSAEHPQVKPLWESPLERETLELADDESAYRSFFPAVFEHYSEHPALVKRIALARKFERLAAVVQFVFDLEYCRRLPEQRKQLNIDGPVKKLLVDAIDQSLTEYLREPDAPPAKDLFQALAACSDYERVVCTIIEHHTGHQRSKGTSPFFDNQGVRVRDRVDDQSIAARLQAVEEDPVQAMERITFWYRRNWHFGRAYQWARYAGVVS